MAAVTFATISMVLDDLEDCWELDQRCFEDGEAYDRATFRDLMTHRNSICLKAVAAETVMAGFVVGVVEPDRTGHVVVLGVAPDWRRRGIARELMLRLEEAFVARGVRLIHLEVRTTNNGARALYDTLGFTIAGRRLAYYTNGDDGYLMVKSVVRNP
jgi:[ribosomal protein S18]-alanine N-acetyltransferase